MCKSEKVYLMNLYLSEKKINKAIETRDPSHLKYYFDMDYLKRRRSKYLSDGILLKAAISSRNSVFDNLLKMLYPEDITNEMLLPILQTLVNEGDEDRFNKVWKLVDVNVIDKKMMDVLIQESRLTLNRIKRKDTYISSMSIRK